MESNDPWIKRIAVCFLGAVSLVTAYGCLAAEKGEISNALCILGGGAITGLAGILNTSKPNGTNGNGSNTSAVNAFTNSPSKP